VCSPVFVKTLWIFIAARSYLLFIFEPYKDHNWQTDIVTRLFFVFGYSILGFEIRKNVMTCELSLNWLDSSCLTVYVGTRNSKTDKTYKASSRLPPAVNTADPESGDADESDDDIGGFNDTSVRPQRGGDMKPDKKESQTGRGDTSGRGSGVRAAQKETLGGRQDDRVHAFSKPVTQNTPAKQDKEEEGQRYVCYLFCNK